jgi:hypothetical protein
MIFFSLIGNFNSYHSEIIRFLLNILIKILKKVFFQRINNDKIKI